MYVDYAYYSTVYQGPVKESGFSPLSIKASSLVDYYTFNRIEEADEKVKLAVCELIDYLDKNKGKEDKEISSEKVGTYSVSYSDKRSQSNSQKQKQIIKKYLGHTDLMYRGV